MAVPPHSLAAIGQPTLLYGADGRIVVANDLTEALAGRPLVGCSAEAGTTVTVGALPSMMADAAQLAQVFANFVGNALTYRRPGVPLEVRVSAERAGRVWRFAVEDNGIEIAPEYHERIFVILQRLHTHDEYEGTGIGLAMVRKIVERHGCRIGVESTPGRGSTFYFTLPATLGAGSGGRPDLRRADERIGLSSRNPQRANIGARSSTGHDPGYEPAGRAT